MYKALNEAGSGTPTFDQLYDMAKGVTNVATGYKKGAKASEYSYSSLAKAASKMVAVFPVLASRTVSAETAQMVTKYIEQKMCSLFVLALQQANISTAKSGIEYLRQYHQNLNIGGDNINAIINTMNTWIDAYESGKINETASFSGSMYDADISIDFASLFESDRDLEIPAHEVASLMKLMQEQENIVVYDTKLNPVSINDYIVKEFDTGDYHVSVKPMSSFTEAKSGGLRSNYRQLVDDGAAKRDEALEMQNDDDADTEYAYQNKKRTWEEEDRKASQARDTAREKEHQEDRKERQEDREESRKDRQRRIDQQAYDRREAKRDRKTSRDEHREDRRRANMTRKNQEESRKYSGNNVGMKDMDVKKMNDAVPSMLVVRFYNQNPKTGTISDVPTEFIIGVKSKLIPVTTSEILRRIMNDNKDGKKFLKFMRLMTGELSASNVLFGFAQMKEDVKSTKRKGAYGEVWNLLANRAAASKEAVKHGVRNDFSAITTVLISQNDADELFREENFDIADPKNAYHFMQSYNLIAFAIADDATESLKIMMDDGERNFEEYAYRMFERESKDGTYKKLINLMAASK